ncbi:MAG: hypothetical protein Q9170_003615 [Blastenia crenularia]
MAAEAPDPKSFQSWEDAFQYPIAAVRGMERQLRNDIDSNREKLRSLVGHSYRDLLGTADSILAMDSQMQEVESYLGGIGLRCNSRLLEKKASNLRAWNNRTKSRDNDRHALASQMAVLRGCPEVVLRLLESGSSVLLAAKILVLSRLLHKKLSQRSDPPPYLEILRQRLASLRRKLLARIDRRFQSLETPIQVLLQAMCAFSLATSSSATDVLRHFHHVRQSAMSELGTGRHNDRGIFKALSTFIKTLRDCHDLVPAQLARALERLKSIPLLQGSDINSLLELNLDIHQRWLGEDICNFIPYIRHDDLQKPEATRLSKHWASEAYAPFLKDLGDNIRDVKGPAVILDLRQEMLELWFTNQRFLIGVDVAEILDGLRAAFNQRFRELFHWHSASLSDVASAVESLLGKWQSGVSEQCPSMWDDAFTTIDTASGSRGLKEALSTRAYGRSSPVRAVSTAYASWSESIRELEEVVRGMREKKWADNIDEMDDDDDSLEDKQVLLSEDDPRLLQETLDDALKQAFQKLHEAIQSHAEQLRDEHSDSLEAGHKACFLLRISREITTQLPPSYSDPEKRNSSVATLQSRIASSTMQQPLSRFGRRVIKSSHQNRLPIHVLWEGHPLLPVLPTPDMFRLLHDLVKSMTVFGVDIWTSQASSILKHQLREELAPILPRLPEARGQINGHSPKLGNSSIQDQDHPEENHDWRLVEGEDGGAEGDVKPEDMADAQITKPNGEAKELEEPSEDVVRQIRIQRLFDILYLQNATRTRESDAADALDSTQAAIVADIDLTDRDVNRMKKDAEGYWERTKLLFGLLAS